MNIRNFGINLKRKRIEKGMSQEELGKKVGSTTVSICRYERNQRIPMVDVAFKLADALGTTVDELLK